MAGNTNPRVDLNEHSGLGMLGRQDITVDGNSPSLIHSHLGIAQHSVHHRSQFGAQQKDVNTTVGGNRVQSLEDRLFEHTSAQVTDQASLNVNGGTSLRSTIC